MKKIITLLFVSAIVAGCCCNCSKESAVKSPDGRNRIKLFVNPLSYEVVRDGVTVVGRSAIALQLEGETLTGSGKVARVSCGSYSGRASSPVYKKGEVDLTGNWVYADYGDWGVRLVARNDGVAYRFETKKKGRIKVFSGNYTGVNPINPADTIDLNNGYIECQYTSNPSFGYILKDVITVEN